MFTFVRNCQAVFLSACAIFIPNSHSVYSHFPKSQCGKRQERDPNPSLSHFLSVSNPLLITVWTISPVSVPRCRSSLFGPHKWSFEVKIAQGPARVSSVLRQSYQSWMALGSRNKFIFFSFFLCPPDQLFQIFFLANAHSVKTPALYLYCVVFLSHSPVICLPSSCFNTTTVSPWCPSR